MRVAIAGASGRMGRMLVEAVLASGDCTLAGALDMAGSPALGQDAGNFLGRSTGVTVTADLHAALAGADVLIDFTRPEGTLAHLAVCRELGVKAVVGTTGFTPRQKTEIAAHAEHTAIVLAPNMSVGVNVMLRLLDMATRALGEGYDIEVIEAHHKHKVDAPSGTALAMGEVLAARRRDRFLHRARRRHRRRPHGAVCRHRRAHRDHAPQQQPRQLRRGQPAGGALRRRPVVRAVRHGPGAGPGDMRRGPSAPRRHGEPWTA